VRLLRDGDAIRLVGTTSQADHTDAMRSFARRRVAELGADDLCGYVLKEDYRGGLVPLIVPNTMIRHYVRRFAVSYLDGQTYLAPQPKELMLRNYV
jgi:uncharacterized protein YbgA (DUF1722 family)